VLLVKVLDVTPAEPGVSRPPPKMVAELPVNVLALTVAVPSLNRPPPLMAELEAKVLPPTVAMPGLWRPPWLNRPPPSSTAELPVNALPLTLADAPSSLASPPP
jgi:hypothetical protein